jgi:hypothetical protein
MKNAFINSLPHSGKVLPTLRRSLALKAADHRIG